MDSKPRVSTNPFSFGIKHKDTDSNTTSSNSSVHQKAAASLASFLNYNPTLSQKAKPIKTGQPSYIQQYNTYNAPNYYNVNKHNNYHKNNKRPFHAMNNNYNNNNNNNNNNHHDNKRRKRQKYPNDGGLTDVQYQSIIEARKNETEQDIKRYIEERKKRFPTKKNIEKKREIIQAKTKRGQLLSINERIMKYQDDTGRKKTPSVLRFLKTPRFDQNIVRKVMQKEINQEYSAILQCFRYIIKSNYLQNDIDLQQNDDEQMDNLYNDNNHNHNHNYTQQDNGNSKEIEIMEECAFKMEEIEKDEMMMEQDEEGEEEQDDDLNIELDAILAQNPKVKFEWSKIVAPK